MKGLEPFGQGSLPLASITQQVSKIGPLPQMIPDPSSSIFSYNFWKKNPSVISKTIIAGIFKNTRPYFVGVISLKNLSIGVCVGDSEEIFQRVFGGTFE